MGGPLEAARLQFLPQVFLFVGKLARQGFYGNAVLRAEVTPENETKIELAGFIGDGVVDFWFFLVAGHDCAFPSLRVIGV